MGAGSRASKKGQGKPAEFSRHRQPNLAPAQGREKRVLLIFDGVTAAAVFFLLTREQLVSRCPVKSCAGQVLAPL